MSVDIHWGDAIARLGNLAPGHFLLAECRFTSNACVIDGQRVFPEEDPERCQGADYADRHPQESWVRSGARVILRKPEPDEESKYYQSRHNPHRVGCSEPTLSVSH